MLLVTTLHLREGRKRAEKLVLDTLSSQLDWNQRLPKLVSATENQCPLPARDMCKDDDDSDDCHERRGAPGETIFLSIPWLFLLHHILDTNSLISFNL